MSQPITAIPVQVRGHLLIKDDQNNVLVDKENAVHPQNMARIIGRAFADQLDNYYINRMAFGNGGTIVSSNNMITYKTPNDGQPPDPQTWKSALYNEVYSEIVDPQQKHGAMGSGPGAVPSDDPPFVPWVSGPGVRSTELGLTTQVLIECVLNPAEPTGEFLTDTVGPPNVLSNEGTFVFDEIGLFTAGLPQTTTQGYQDANVSVRKATDDTGLAGSTAYDFSIAIDGGAAANKSITTPAAGSGPLGAITYSDLITLINIQISPAALASIDDDPPTTNTFGNLRFTSATSGAASAIVLANASILPPLHLQLFPNLNAFVSFVPAVNGSAAGLQNNPTDPSQEAFRLLTHIIFSPVLKSANRTLTILYTLTISVARSSF
jgi:hypothetical protein